MQQNLAAFSARRILQLGSEDFSKIALLPFSPILGHSQPLLGSSRPSRRYRHNRSFFRPSIYLHQKLSKIALTTKSWNSGHTRAACPLKLGLMQPVKGNTTRAPSISVRLAQFNLCSKATLNQTAQLVRSHQRTNHSWSMASRRRLSRRFGAWYVMLRDLREQQRN